jgi:hypothetical protein
VPVVREEAGEAGVVEDVGARGGCGNRGQLTKRAPPRWNTSTGRRRTSLG